MLCYVMLCYVMLCYVMLCYVMLCYVMLCYVMLCYVMFCYVMLYVMFYVVLCYAMICYVMLWYAMLCYVTLRYAALRYVALCYALYIMLSILNCTILKEFCKLYPIVQTLSTIIFAYLFLMGICIRKLISTLTSLYVIQSWLFVPAAKKLWICREIKAILLQQRLLLVVH